RARRRRAGGREPAGRTAELGVLTQDRDLEGLQLRARSETQILGEHLPPCAVDRERVGLAAGAVEGDHELATDPFPQRMRADEGLELPDDLVVMPQRKLGVDATFKREEAQFLEPGLLALQDV